MAEFVRRLNDGEAYHVIDGAFETDEVQKCREEFIPLARHTVDAKKAKENDRGNAKAAADKVRKALCGIQKALRVNEGNADEEIIVDEPRDPAVLGAARLLQQGFCAAPQGLHEQIVGGEKLQQGRQLAILDIADVCFPRPQAQCADGAFAP